MFKVIYCVSSFVLLGTAGTKVKETVPALSGSSQFIISEQINTIQYTR